jgi:hypothetical protein
MKSFANEILYLETSSETLRDKLSSFFTEIVTIERLIDMKKVLVFENCSITKEFYLDRFISNILLFSTEIIQVTITEL